MAKIVVRVKAKTEKDVSRFGWGDDHAADCFLAPVTHKGDRFIVRVKFNPNHAPAGGSDGGQFTSGDGGGSSSVLFEVAPDPHDTALTERWNSLSDAEKMAVSKDVAKDILPAVLKAAGTKGDIIELVGGYMGATNPSLSVEVTNPDKAVGFAALLGHALSQDSMIVLSGKPTAGLDEIGAVVVKLPTGERDIGSLTKMYDNLYQIKDSKGESLVGGFNAINGRMEILNFSDTNTGKLAQMVDKQLGGKYEVSQAKAYSSFLDKKDYANAGSGMGRNSSVWGKNSSSLRDQAVQAIQTELGRRGKAQG